MYDETEQELFERSSSSDDQIERKKMKKKYEFRDKSDTCIKCVLVGDAGVGKSSLAARLSSRKFNEEYTPTIFDNYAATVMLDEKPFHFSLFDTAGKEDYDRLRVISYMNCDIFLVCFSVVDRETLESIEAHWVPELHHYMPNTPFILVGTRADQRNESDDSINPNPEVTYKEALEVANRCGAEMYIECSSYTGECVSDVVKETIETLLKNGSCKQRPIGCCGCNIV